MSSFTKTIKRKKLMSEINLYNNCNTESFDNNLNQYTDNDNSSQVIIEDWRGLRRSIRRVRRIIPSRRRYRRRRYRRPRYRRRRSRKKKRKRGGLWALRKFSNIGKTFRNLSRRITSIHKSYLAYRRSGGVPKYYLKAYYRKVKNICWVKNRLRKKANALLKLYKRYRKKFMDQEHSYMY